MKKALLSLSPQGQIIKIFTGTPYDLGIDRKKLTHFLFVNDVCPDTVAKTHYVLNGELTLRPEQTTTLSNTPVIANGLDEGVLAHLPIPCTVFIEKTPYRVEDGVLEFTLSLPGIYPIRVTDCFPYLDKEFTCEGIAPV